MLLAWRDSALRDTARRPRIPGRPVECRGHGAPGVARGRHEHRHGPAVAARVGSRRDALGEEARAEVLERRGRPVEQLEHAQCRGPIGTSGTGKSNARAQQMRQIGRRAGRPRGTARARARRPPRSSAPARPRPGRFAGSARARRGHRPAQGPGRIASEKKTAGARPRVLTNLTSGFLRPTWRRCARRARRARRSSCRMRGRGSRTRRAPPPQRWPERDPPAAQANTLGPDPEIANASAPAWVAARVHFVEPGDEPRALRLGDEVDHRRRGEVDIVPVSSRR